MTPPAATSTRLTPLSGLKPAQIIKWKHLLHYLDSSQLLQPEDLE